MANSGGWLDRLVDGLPQTPFFRFVASQILVRFWAWRTPVKPQPGGPPFAVQPGDNLQRMMNLIMPLKDKSPIGRAKAALAVAQNKEGIFAGLDNVGTVHFARFVIVENNICMFSVYDGDFANYIRDFIITIGSVFDALVALVEDGDAVLPTEEHVEAFIQWVHARDMFQVSDQATDLLAAQQALDGSSFDGDLRLLPRDLILQLNVNRNVSLGSGYRAYPGYSAAQVRQNCGLGW